MTAPNALQLQQHLLHRQLLQSVGLSHCLVPHR